MVTRKCSFIDEDFLISEPVNTIPMCQRDLENVIKGLEEEDWRQTVRGSQRHP